MPALGKTFRVFVSSTFSDLAEERNALQQHVFPPLRELCWQNGCRFQAIDLRWGVREEAGLDQQTMKICLEEIERSQRISPRPNFIVLLGDRYGWRPLPPEIPVDEFKRVRGLVTDSEEGPLLDDWYRLDKNAVPPVYYLRPRTVPVAPGAGDDERRRAAQDEARTWGKVERRLHRILSVAAKQAGLPADSMFKYAASATEQEVEAGAMKAADAKAHVFGFFRSIKGLPRDKSAAGYIDLDDCDRQDEDAGTALAALKERLEDHLDKGTPVLEKNIHYYEAQWQDGTISKDHLSALCRDALGKLSAVILSQMAQMVSVDPVDKEKSDHAAFGKDRARSFIGREGPQRRISDYLAGQGTGPLAIFGAPGSGKSALMALAAAQAAEASTGAEVVSRFLGVTPFSTDVRSLLEGLCRQVSRAYGAEEASIPSEYKDLVDEFPKRLALAASPKPLFVFLDALDQLSDSHNGRNLLWLPAALPENVRLVVSTAPADCWDVLKRKTPESNQVELEPMTTADGVQILETWLRDAGRTLRDSQRAEVLGKFAKTGLPLYLKFAFEEARKWRSDSPVPVLEPEVTGIIRQLFARLSSEANHGGVFVSHGLAYLRAAKNGLTEDEMIDVLSRDEDVKEDFEKRLFFKPPEEKLPVVLWSRFSLDIAPYLNERSADGTRLMGFFHRQMGEVVDAEYLAGEAKARMHAGLAAYFAMQPLFAEKEGQKVANLRKLSELPFQQARGELWKDVYETLTDFDFLEAKCTYSGIISAPEGESGRKIYGGVYELIEDYQRTLAVFPADK